MFNVHRLDCWLQLLLLHLLIFHSLLPFLKYVYCSCTGNQSTATYFILKICANRCCSKYVVFTGQYPHQLYVIVSTELSGHSCAKDGWIIFIHLFGWFIIFVVHWKLEFTFAHLNWIPFSTYPIRQQCIAFEFWMFHLFDFH